MKTFLAVMAVSVPSIAFASLPATYSDKPKAPSGYLGECPAQDFEFLIGKDGRFLEWLSEDMERVRIITPGRAYTMDYIPDRLNVHMDNSGVIERVSCG